MEPFTLLTLGERDHTLVNIMPIPRDLLDDNRSHP
jgi:hypothetical protein